MNKQEYAQYEATVAAFFETEGLNCLTVDEDCKKPYFSWSDCDCCGSTLGGDRYDCSGYNPTTKEVRDGYSVCVDCVYYTTYGRLDDMTMMDMEVAK